MQAHTLTVDEIARSFKSSKTIGLSGNAIIKNSKEYGRNVITPQKKKSFIKRLIAALSEPMLLILEFAWVITAGVNIGKFIKNGEADFYECIGILLCVLLSACLTLFMEGRSQKAFEVLGKVYDKINVKVIRDGKVHLVAKEDIVCGDLVILEAGNKIVADGRLVESEGLSVDESMLTGESGQVEKSAYVNFSKPVPLAERKNMVWSGTFVGAGIGKMIVTAVGDNAELGKIASNIGAKETNAPLNEKLDKLGKVVTIIGGISAGLVFILSVVRLMILQDFNFFSVQDAFLEAIVLIVAAVPEGLPTTAALSLTLNVVKLAKSNALIKKLVAAETVGAVSVICSDKTGTLTQNQMTVTNFFISRGCEKEVILNSAINSTAQLKQSKNKVEVHGSATEGALLKWLCKKGYDYQEYRDKRLIGRVIPFDSSKKYMITEYYGEQKTVFIKGAPEIIIENSNLQQYEKSKIFREIEKSQKEGKRVIAFSSYKGELTDNQFAMRGARFDGYAVISDPIRKEVKEAVTRCKQAKIDVIMLTGDNRETATAIAKELGIIKNERQVVTVDKLEEYDDASLKNVLRSVKVIARSTPTTKLKIVESLQEMGEVVVVTGDGVNDAPAISKADVGIAMGSGSEITKEASDIVLLDDSFSTIVKAVSFGRNIFKNFQRFITFQLTVNVTAMIVVIVSLAIGFTNPFTAVQLLWIDIIMDGPPALTLAMENDKGQFMTEKPVKRTDGILNFPMLLRIITQGIFMAIVVLLQYGYDFIGVGREAIPTSVFCLFVIFQLFNAFNCRKIGSESIFKGIGDNKLMLAVFFATFVFQIIITQYLCGFFSTVKLSVVSWVKIISIGFLSVVFSEIAKVLYKIFKNSKISLIKKRKS